MPTKIQWADETWNPITGCTPISEGCKNCYAERMAKRLAGRYGYPKDEPFTPATFHPDKIDINLFPAGKRVFVCSMGDLFHESVNIRGDDIREVFRCMAHHDNTFLLLTKRPKRMHACIQHIYGDYVFESAPHLWVGATAENQGNLMGRTEHLLRIRASVRYLSIEPMLGPVHIGVFAQKALNGCELNCPGTRHLCRCHSGECHGAYESVRGIDWVICGPETGPGKRPFNFDWARDLRDQCAAAGIPFFYKKHDDPSTPEDLRIAEFPK